MTGREAALYYRSQGLWPIPIPNGGKRPTLSGWPNKRFEPDQIQLYWAGNSTGVGIITGPDGLVCVDLDDQTAVEFAADFLPPTRAIVGRPGNPRSHWFFFIEDGFEVPQSGFKITRKLDDGRKETKTVLDVRAKGGQVLVGPSVHPDSGEVYEMLDPTLIDRVEGAILLEGIQGLFARVCLEKAKQGWEILEASGVSKPKKTFCPALPTPADDKPWSHYNTQDHWRVVLDCAGWTVAGQSGGEVRWRRPGKRFGHSAIWHQDRGFLHVFSSSCEHLEQGRNYDPFGILCQVRFGGDAKQAVGWLRQNNFIPEGQKANLDPSWIDECFPDPTKSKPDSTTETPLPAKSERARGKKSSGKKLNEYDDMPPLEFLIKDLLPREGLGMVVGVGGAGKSTFLSQLVVWAVKGFRGDSDELPPGSRPCEPRRVLYTTGHEESGEKLKKRMTALGIGDSIGLVTVLDGFEDDAGKRHDLEFPRDLGFFEEEVKRTKANFIVIDNWTQFATDENISKTVANTKLILSTMNRICKENKALILFVDHSAKGKESAGGNQSQAVSGQVSKTNLPRFQLMIREHPDNLIKSEINSLTGDRNKESADEKYIAWITKSNDYKDKLALVFTRKIIKQRDGYETWKPCFEPELSRFTDSDFDRSTIKAAAARRLGRDNKGRKGRPSNAAIRCENDLHEFLTAAKDCVTGREINDHLKELGHSKSTIERVKTKLQDEELITRQSFERDGVRLLGYCLQSKLEEFGLGVPEYIHPELHDPGFYQGERNE